MIQKTTSTSLLITCTYVCNVPNVGLGHDVSRSGNTGRRKGPHLVLQTAKLVTFEKIKIYFEIK
jgi:hypothetical protein